MSPYNDGGSVPLPTEFAKWQSRWFEQAKYQGRNVPLKTLIASGLALPVTIIARLPAMLRRRTGFSSR